jgi:hypothetical protein
MHLTAVLGNGVSQAVGGKEIGGILNTALSNSKGELVVPVLVTGNMAHPIVTPDAGAKAKMKLSNLLPSTGDPSKFTTGKGIGGILGGILGGQQQQQQTQQQQQPPENPLNSILDQFKKKKKPQ